MDSPLFILLTLLILRRYTLRPTLSPHKILLSLTICLSLLSIETPMSLSVIEALMLLTIYIQINLLVDTFLQYALCAQVAHGYCMALCTL